MVDDYQILSDTNIGDNYSDNYLLFFWPKSQFILLPIYNMWIVVASNFNLLWGGVIPQLIVRIYEFMLMMVVGSSSVNWECL